ncbi:hypothetical protein ES703_64798 [subsurface metagenome]
MLCLVRTKACKRCGGDLSLESDKYGTYLECIQCGAVYNLPDPVKSNAEVKSGHHQPRPVATSNNRV